MNTIGTKVLTPLGTGVIVAEDIASYASDMYGNPTATETSSWGKRWIVQLDDRTRFQHMGKDSNPAFCDTELIHK